MRRQAIIAALLIVGVGVVLGATVFRADIAQATGVADIAKDVKVVNTAAESVPVREQNLDSGNIRVHEEGVANVRDVDNPARQPVMLTDNRSFPTTQNAFTDDLYTVPANKRLIIEYIHGRLSLPTDDPGTCEVFSGGRLLSLPLVHSASLSPLTYPPEQWTADLTLRLYLNAGDHVEVQCLDHLFSGLRVAEVHISGYLVDVG